jgi:hypothetical protein
MSDAPITNRSNGEGSRDERGRFMPGNPGGPGNPAARHARELRSRLDEALFVVCDPARLKTVVDSILKLAEAGDVAAAKLIFERVGGPAIDSTVAERIRQLEAELLEDAQ